MLPLRIEGATRRLAEDQDEFLAISIKDEVVNGVKVMTSAWEVTPKEMKALEGGAELFVTYLTGDDQLMPAVLRLPTEEELYRLRAGGNIRLYVPGTRFPPVCIGVTEPGAKHLYPEQPLAVITVLPPYLEIA